MVVADEDGFRALEGTICIARAYAAGAVDDIAGTVNLARRALDVLPEDAHMWLGAGAALLGIASWTMGDLEAAHRSYSAGMVSLQKAGQGRMQICAIYTLADIEVSQGRLRQAENTFLSTLQIATAQGDPMWGTRDIYVGLADLARERDDLDAARDYLAKANEAGKHAGLLETRHRRYVAMARVKEAEGDLDSALHLLADAEHQYVGGPDPNLHPIPALRAHIWIAQGKLAEAFAWARERTLTIDDDLSYVREFEHLTLARLFIAHAKRERHSRSLQDAIHLLDRLLPAAEQGERPGSVIEILVLEALAHEARGDIPRALASLKRALTLAEPETYVRTFVAEGEPMRTLLLGAAAEGVTPSYTRRLLSAFEKLDRPTTPNLADPLTTREIEILRLIAAGLRNQEIADRLFISLPTVKRHIANTYGKLDVTHRTEAISRATELNLL
jgi:LuxR family maltose regulon positive regulatory protein